MGQQDERRRPTHHRQFSEFTSWEDVQKATAASALPVSAGASAAGPVPREPAERGPSPLNALLGHPPPRAARPSSSPLPAFFPQPPFRPSPQASQAAKGGPQAHHHLRKPSTFRMDAHKAPASVFDSQPFWLVLYFAFNLGLTLYNKSVLVSFPFPYTVTALHALCCSFGGWYVRQYGLYEPAQLGFAENVTLLCFSMLYTVNIAVSNVSLHLVTVPFHQVVRAMTPIFTILFSAMLIGTRCSAIKLLSLLPVMLGVGFATYGDYSFTQWGLCLTLLGTVLAALKTVFTNILQKGSRTPNNPSSLLSSEPKFLSSAGSTLPGGSHAGVRAGRWRPRALPPLALHPLDLLTRLSPLAFVQCVLAAHLSGELGRVRADAVIHMTPRQGAALLVNGAIAFGLNVVSFTTNKKAGPVSMSVAANVKQVLTITLAVLVFDLTLSPLNVFGILLSLLGGAWYARVEYVERMLASSSF